MADITEIKRKLADQAQTVAEMLLPAGRKMGAEWEAGSVGGEKGSSLKVHLTGSKAGVWQDFATGEGGDLIDLWMQTRGVSLADALNAARDYLGLTRQQVYLQPSKNYSKPPAPKGQKPQARVLDYLREDRNISGETIARYRLGENGNEIVFPFWKSSGELALVKTRLAENGARPKPTAANCEPILFGWQAMPEKAREVVITEGEIDALSWADYGYNALSVPFGGGKGGKQNWIENEYDNLERFERIYIATDMDEQGELAAAEIANRLGCHRCYRVSMPLKDANECLVEGVERAEMDKAITEAKSLDPEGLRRASDYTDKVVNLFWPQGEAQAGYSVPYGKLGGKLHFRAGELSLWGGASGAGKSQILSDCIPHWIKQGSRICLASLEMKGEQSLRRLTKQVGGVDRPTEEYIHKIMRWLDPGLLIYERVGKASVEALLDVFNYARAKYGCDQFIIDSLMRLGIASDDYVGQEKAVFKIVDWAVSSHVHVHLVAHARKSGMDKSVPETEDVKGASEIGANAFNIITIWRNRKVEEDLQKATTEADRQDAKRRPGVVINVAKQRSGDFEGKIGLWFDQKTYRYFSAHDDQTWQRSYIGHGENENGRVAA